MQLYTGSSKQFIEDTVQNRITDLMRTSFFRQCRYYPSPSEVNSWRNPLRAMCNVVQYASLNDNGVLLEYQLPLTSKRLDCMLTGKKCRIERQRRYRRIKTVGTDPAERDRGLRRHLGCSTDARCSPPIAAGR